MKANKKARMSKSTLKVRKPKNIVLTDQSCESYALKMEAVDGYLYLKPDKTQFYWVGNVTRAKQLHRWLTSAIAYLEQKERK